MPEPDKILRIRTVLHRTGLSRSTLYRKMKEGTFPNQVRISEHCSGWHESEIARWIADPEHYGRSAPDSRQPELTQSLSPAPRRRPSP
jgi:prophage regulatory protein